MQRNKVLLIGSGGREHALAWALSRSVQVEKVFVATGNGGTEWAENSNATGLQPIAPAENVSIAINDFPALIAFAQENEVALTVVGPEQPLADGIVDEFQKAGLAIFGATQAAARLEASKAFAKDFMRDHNIPTADYAIFSDYESALAHVKTTDGNLVIKADGLAAGKGVLICDNQNEAQAALQKIMLERAFASAGDKVVIEEKLVGREVSVLAFTDGKTVVPMRLARDYKRALDADEGLNTGGMGAFAPTTDVPDALLEEILSTVIQATVDGMAVNGTPYVGVLYAGLMLTENGPRVLEFNCRFGDPETQVILPLLKSDIYEVFQACINGSLDSLDINWHEGTCATVVLASGGYPESYEKGKPITGLDALAARDDVIAFHAGTACHDGKILTSGGRVLAITALASSLPEALEQAYSAVGQLQFSGMHYRRDIGKGASS